MKTKFNCPLCGKPLSEREYLSVTGRWEHLHELETKFKRQLKTAVDNARRDERTKVSNQVLVKSRQIVHLRGQIARLKAQSEKGLTPQLAGLLYEKELQKALADKFPQDEVVHTGKGGDVLQHVRLNGRRVGTIVYECKDVSKLQRGHVDQARRAKVQRGAEYAVVVTAAKVANSFGFWVERDVLLIHPAGVVVLWLPGCETRSWSWPRRDCPRPRARKQLAGSWRSSAAPTSGMPCRTRFGGPRNSVNS